MAKRKRPSVDKFREFVKEHPHLVNEVRSKQATWQELFEEWYLLGEDHPRWQADGSVGAPKENIGSPSPPVEKGDQSTELIGSLMSAVKNMDMGQIQQYITNANQAIGAIKECYLLSKGINQVIPVLPQKKKSRELTLFYSPKIKEGFSCVRIYMNSFKQMKICEIT
ncbi:spore coat protein YlbD [Peribacillus frigoritolerans]|nr:spore coat protein YlbD [Peribacillus frigoritolerans]